MHWLKKTQITNIDWISNDNNKIQRKNASQIKTGQDAFLRCAVKQTEEYLRYEIAGVCIVVCPEKCRLLTITITIIIASAHFPTKLLSGN